MSDQEIEIHVLIDRKLGTIVVDDNTYFGTVRVASSNIFGTVRVSGGVPGPAGLNGQDGQDGQDGGINPVLLDEHIESLEPHPVYDDLPSMTLLFENGLI